MTEPDIPGALGAYFERATIALSLADGGDDTPLVLVNEAFRELTGYADDDVIGRNCRMLQRDAENAEARDRIHLFLRPDGPASVRTPIVNFRKDGRPFVNLLYLSKLRSGGDGAVRFLFASQFDVSRSQPDRLAAYDAELSGTLKRLSPTLAGSGVALEGSLMAIANTAAAIAQAKLTLDELG